MYIKFKKHFTAPIEPCWVLEINRKDMANEKPWGGPWTEQKLDAFENYVTAYLAIMNKQSQWKTIYFDGFAGSGRIEFKK